MIAELFLFVSTMCVTPISASTFMYSYGEPYEKNGKCFQTVRFSTVSIPNQGETAYRVFPATMTVYTAKECVDALLNVERQNKLETIPMWKFSPPPPGPEEPAGYKESK